MTWTVTIPYQVPSQNRHNGYHWRHKYKDTKRAEQLLRHYAWEIPRATGRRRIDIIAYRRQRCADIGNLIGGAKGLIDAIKRCALIIDDDDKNVVITYSQEICSKIPSDIVRHFGKQPVTTITLGDL